MSMKATIVMSTAESEEEMTGESADKLMCLWTAMAELEEKPAGESVEMALWLGLMVVAAMDMNRRQQGLWW